MHAHALRVPQPQFPKFRKTHEGRQFLSLFEDIGRILEEHEDVLAIYLKVPVLGFQGVCIYLQGQYACPLADVTVYLVGLCGKLYVQFWNYGIYAVRGVLHGEVRSLKLAKDVRGANPAHVKLGQPHLSMKLSVYGTGAGNAALCGESVCEGIHAGPCRAVKCNEGVFSKDIPDPAL